MELDLYISFTRYLTTFVFSFFVYQFFASLANYYQIRDRNILWPAAMCISTACYCFVFAFNTHFINQKLSDFILIVFWICAYSSFYCYLRTVEIYFGHKVKGLSFAKTFCLFFVVTQLICSFTTLAFDFNFLFDKHNYVKDSLFARTMNFNVSPNLMGKALGGIGALVVFYSCTMVWLELNRLKKKERLLRLGIIISFLVVLNDSLLGLEVTGAILPLYYFGNAFEAVRFNIYYRNLSYRKMYNLETEVIRLSKIAQFGFAAASIAHDIRNHIFIIKISIERLIRGRSTNPEETYLSIDKHTDKITEITNLYMDVFKKNTNNIKSDTTIKFVIEEALELVAAKFREAGVKLEVDIANFDLCCNQTEVTICLVNILKNALEEVSQEGKYDAPWVKIKTDADTRKLSIIDCGHGVITVSKEELFSLGYTTKGSAGGHGIGLAITKELLGRAGFRLDLDRDELNTTFVIDF
ncbi:ATP-binding protein [Halobacteriovorax sp. XZX-3]|uniref:sensor histidine kinase n=1 Tax=unclassified Halobacteriovorax TaxID=2639665 RepID=UPI00371C55FA